MRACSLACQALSRLVWLSGCYVRFQQWVLRNPHSSRLTAFLPYWKVKLDTICGYSPHCVFLHTKPTCYAVYTQKTSCRRFLLISNLPTQGRTVLVVQRLAVGRQLRLLSPSWTDCLKTPMESLPSSSVQLGVWASLISHVQRGHMFSLFTYLVLTFRELVYQIADQFRVFGRHIGLKDAVIVGGIG